MAAECWSVCCRRARWTGTSEVDIGGGIGDEFFDQQCVGLSSSPAAATAFARRRRWQHSPKAMARGARMGKSSPPDFGPGRAGFGDSQRLRPYPDGSATFEPNEVSVALAESVRLTCAVMIRGAVSSDILTSHREEVQACSRRSTSVNSLPARTRRCSLRRPGQGGDRDGRAVRAAGRAGQESGCRRITILRAHSACGCITRERRRRRRDPRPGSRCCRPVWSRSTS